VREGMSKKDFGYVRKVERGVSFPELVFSITLVALVLVTMIGTLISGLESLQKGTSYNQANIIAQRKVETFKILDYADIPVSSNVTSEEGFVVTTTVTESDYPYSILSPKLKYKKLTVSVAKAGDLGSTTATNRATKRVNVVMEAFIIDN